MFLCRTTRKNFGNWHNLVWKSLRGGASMLWSAANAQKHCYRPRKIGGGGGGGNRDWNEHVQTRKYYKRKEIRLGGGTPFCNHYTTWQNLSYLPELLECNKWQKWRACLTKISLFFGKCAPLMKCVLTFTKTTFSWKEYMSFFPIFFQNLILQILNFTFVVILYFLN